MPQASLREFSYNNTKYGFECLPEDQYRKRDEEITGLEPETPRSGLTPSMDDILGDLEENVENQEE